MFLRFMMLVKREMPYDTDLNTIEIKDVNLAFIETISVSDIFRLFVLSRQRPCL